MILLLFELFYQSLSRPLPPWAQPRGHQIHSLDCEYQHQLWLYFEEFIDLNTSVGETEGDLNMTLDEEVEAVSEDQVLTRAQWLVDKV